MTRDQVIAELKEKNPTMKSGNDTDGYVEFTSEEYEAQINEWADYLIAEAKFKKEAEKVKTETEAAKSALLTKLGISAEEAALLLK
jgi:hypothetical protein